MKCLLYISAILRSIRVVGNTIPEKGHDLGIQCEIFDFKSSNVASLYTTQDENLSDFNKPLTNCTRLGCVPSGVLNRYSFMTSESGILINIKELVRETDQRWWHCKVDGQKERLNLIIYSKCGAKIFYYMQFWTCFYTCRLITTDTCNQITTFEIGKFVDYSSRNCVLPPNDVYSKTLLSPHFYFAIISFHINNKSI